MTNVNGLSAELLTSIIERVERLLEEKANLSEDIKLVFAEAKNQGFDVKTLKEIIKLRSKDASELEEQEYLLETYKRALGMTEANDEEGEI